MSLLVSVPNLTRYLAHLSGLLTMALAISEKHATKGISFAARDEETRRLGI